MKHENAGDFWLIGEDIEVKNMAKYRSGPKDNWGVTEGKQRQIFAMLYNEKPLGKRNKMKIECVGNEIKVWVNGKLSNYGFNATVSRGQIAVQAEGVEVEFKKIRLKRL